MPPDENVVVEPTQEQIEAESNAAFENGFNAERGITPPAEKPAVEAVQAEEPPAKAEEPKVEAQPDPWEGVNPKVKAELESVSAKLASIDKLPDRLRNIEGHIGGLTSQLKTALATAKAVEKTGTEAPTEAQIKAAGAYTSEKWKRLEEDFPDWAAAMDERLATLKPAAEAPAVDVAGIKQEVSTEITKSVEERITEARQLARIDAKYPDWEEEVATKEFKAWKATQKPEIQALGASPLAKDAIAMLDLYATAKKAAAKKAAEDAANKKRLESAITPKGTGVPAPHTIDDDEAFDRGYKKASGK